MGRNTNRPRNKNTLADPNSNASWKKEQLKKYPLEQQNKLLPQIYKHQRYFNHYYSWLQQIAYQLYEWDFPSNKIPKRMVEALLHENGVLGYNNSNKHGLILSRGVPSGFGTYQYPTEFRSSEKPFEYNSFPVYYYGRYKFENSGLLLKNKLATNNTQIDLSSISTFQIYAEQLAFLKQVSDINLNAQKTPIIVAVDEDILLSDMEDLYDYYDGGMPVIFSKKLINEKGQTKVNQLIDNIKVLKTDSPFILDKIETQKQKVWDEAMGCFGVMNMAQYKAERMTAHESQANMEQVKAMSNSMLQARLEFTDLAEELTGEKIKVSQSNMIFTTPDGTEYKQVEGDPNGDTKKEE